MIDIFDNLQKRNANRQKWQEWSSPWQKVKTAGGDSNTISNNYCMCSSAREYRQATTKPTLPLTHDLNHNWRKQSHWKLPEEQWQLWSNRSRNLTDTCWSYMLAIWVETNETPCPEANNDFGFNISKVNRFHFKYTFHIIVVAEDQIQQLPSSSHLAVAAKCVLSASYVGTKPATSQTFILLSLGELVIVVKIFSTSHQSQGIWGTDQDNKVALVSLSLSHTHTSVSGHWFWVSPFNCL